jgi:hypothetical protein
MSYELSIVISGPGIDPQYRSHWGFIIHRTGDDYGELLHTLLIDLGGLWYQFENRSGIPLISHESEGRFKIATLDYERHIEAKRIISEEPPPRDGKKRCQDWVLDVVISLEVGEIVDAGLSNRVEGLVGKSAEDLAAAVGSAWVSAKDD